MEIPTDFFTKHLFTPYLETLIGACEHAQNNSKCAHVGATIFNIDSPDDFVVCSNIATSHAEMVALTRHQEKYFEKPNRGLDEGLLRGTRHYDHSCSQEWRAGDIQAVFRLSSGFEGVWNTQCVLYQPCGRVGDGAC